MNRPDGQKALIPKNKKHSQNKNANESRSSSGFSFFRWFKKDESRKSKSNASKVTKSSIGNLKSDHNESVETLSESTASQSATLDNLSKSSSCSSILSTETTGFSFVPITNYKTTDASTSHAERLITPGPFTDSYKRRLRQREETREQDRKFELTLRKKYKIFSSLRHDHTLTRENNNQSGHPYGDLSLPAVRKRPEIDLACSTTHRDKPENCKRHRRTVSDSSKDKKAGAYVHVKGKRKAPPPPPLNLESRANSLVGSNQNTLSPRSTLGRKKRPAPPPPVSPLTPTNNILRESSSSLLEDIEIKAIIEGGTNRMSMMPSSCRTLEGQTPKKLTEENKQFLIDSIAKAQNMPLTSSPQLIGKMAGNYSNSNEDLLILEEGFLRIKEVKSPIIEQIYGETAKRTPPQSPISPRPWYKRPLSGVRQESSIPFKRDVVLKTMEKRKGKKDKEKDELPELGFCRNSLSDPSTSKFNFFTKITEKTEDSKKKDSEKRRSGIGIPNISELDREAAEIINKENSMKIAQQKEEDERYYKAEVLVDLRSSVIHEEYEEPRRRSARELINKFEAGSTNVNRSSVNPIISPKKEFSFEEKKMSSKIESSHITDAKNLLGMWKCPYCTVENQNWRIICQVCEKIKPYDTANVLNEPPVSPNYQIKKSVPVVGPKVTDPKNTDWDKKTEKVLQYFMPKESQGNALAKSASETSVGSKFNRKPVGPSKLIGSPKMGMRSMIPRSSPEKPKISKVNEDKMNGKAPDLIQNNQNSMNLDDVRSARIAKFTTQLEQSKPSSPKLDDFRNLESLEREKERLRDMIRAMNAKALKEKYPVVQKPPVAEAHPSKIPQSPQLNKIRKESVMNESISSLQMVQPVTKPPTPTSEAPSKIPQSPKLHSIRNEVTNDPTKLGAIKKYFGRKPEMNGSNEKLNKDESKVINQDQNTRPKLQNGILKKDVCETKLILSNDTNSFHYELIEAGEFKRKNSNVSLENGIAKTQDSQVRFSEQNKPKIEEKTHQMKSQNGTENIKATLRYTPNAMNKTNTLAINKILRNLEGAISDGQHDLAAQLAVDLAKMKVSLSVTRQKGRPLSGVNSTNINIDVYIEDKISHKGPFKLNLSAFSTIGQLKEKMFKDFNIPTSIQKWVYQNQMTSDDEKSLFDYGVHADNSVMNLYLVAAETIKSPISPKKQMNGPIFTNMESNILKISDDSSEDEEFSEIQNNILKDDSVLGATAKTENKAIEEVKTGWECPLCTLINPPNRPGCAACSESRPSKYVVPKEYQISEDYDIPEELKRFLQDDEKLKIEERNDLNIVKSNRKSSDMYNIVVEERKSAKPTTKPSAIPMVNTKDLYTPSNIRVPSQDNIVMTAFTSSPNITKTKYRGVDNYNPKIISQVLPTPKSKTVISTASPIVRDFLLKRGPRAKFGKNGLVLPENGEDLTSSNHYYQLVNLENADLIANIDIFECPICFETTEPGHGIILRDCLHTFCKECLITTIRYNEEPQVKCPFMDNQYSCESIIQEREIKALVNREMYENHLRKSIRHAENRIENTFHCKAPNCPGWCIYEEDVNHFKCPVCTIINCLTCRAIHDGIDCKQYQDRMNSDCDTTTKDMLQDMIDNGEAMNCPTCQVVILKKWGCDWLKCSMCKTEICWITRQARWGPNGKGDTSAGCKCGVNGMKCHEKCTYCH